MVGVVVVASDCPMGWTWRGWRRKRKEKAKKVNSLKMETKQDEKKGGYDEVRRKSEKRGKRMRKKAREDRKWEKKSITEDEKSTIDGRGVRTVENTWEREVKHQAESEQQRGRPKKVR